MSCIRIISAREARETILLRHAPDEVGASAVSMEQSRTLFGEVLSPEQIVTKILSDVRTEGDTALSKYTELLDGAVISDFRINQEEIDKSLNNIPPDLRKALQTSADRIRAFHERQPLESWTHHDEEGAIGQIVRPLERVGLYVPGGRAPLASSLLMAAVPARVAGVKHVAVTTPPGPDGTVHPVILAAACIAGVDAVYSVGGAQAIAALAYGTDTIPRVDKILGPGNIYVVLAKQKVFGIVDIDQLPGPTETLVIADDTCDPAHAAADLLAQSEHDPMASAILITPSESLASQVAVELDTQLQVLERADIIRASLDNNGGIVLSKDIDEAFELANTYAPEHLCLLVDDPWPLVERVENAGGVFVGEHSSEALGDYVTGPSHIMPTGGTARFSSPVNLRDFTKIISLFAVNEKAHRRLCSAAVTLAEAEGLTAHAAAIKQRIDAPSAELPAEDE